MKTVDFKSMEVGTKLESINLESATCTVRMYSGRRSMLIRDVMLSGLLLSRLKSGKWGDLYELGKKYKSSNNSDDRTLNPFQLIKFKKGDKVEYILTAVEQRSTKRVKKGVDMFGNEMYDTVYRFHSKQYYYRYRDLVKIEDNAKQEA